MKRYKYLLLWLVGGYIYYLIEMLYRGYSHWSMFVLGGICFLSIGLINEVLKWSTPLWVQSIIGASIITILEFVTGCIVNLWLGWNVWDYSNLSFNFLGQICLQFFIVWIGIAFIGIILDDYLRFWMLGEERPVYKLF